ncbi:MAG TPA: VOC family protein [Polyangiaceae bacterium]|jgi:catechol 2,3-dioxygenase-like lactoylglutathione lyase family enzyme
MVDFLSREENARRSYRLHHIALGTANVSRLAHFYGEVLELPELKRHYTEQGRLRSIWLELGDALLMIEHSDAAPVRVEGVGAGWFLAALAVSSGERERVEQRLESFGVAIESRTEWTSYARDPDGNRIALSSYPSDTLLKRS